MLHHTVLYLKGVNAAGERHMCLNPWLWNTMMDEDMNGKLMKIVKNCAPQTVQIDATVLYLSHATSVIRGQPVQ